LLSVPGPIAEDAEMRALADTIFAGKEGTPERLKALAVWFRNEGFTYTVRPGRMESLTKFLTRSRKGFCEHYAAASANLLRLAGVPARVITGYRGGRWNPWLRTLTIRDADAHAWVEAWDPNAGNWLRFDATTSVAPGLLLQIELDRDPTRWAWPRTVMVYIETVNTRFQNAIAEGGQFRTVAVIVAVALFLGGLAFFFFRRPKATPADEALAAMLVFGARHEIPRQPGETPLSWIERSKPAHPSASASLERFARAYEQAVYDQPTPEAHCELRAASSALRKT
jgi:hypothetical protein